VKAGAMDTAYTGSCKKTSENRPFLGTSVKKGKNEGRSCQVLRPLVPL
jgi:hypothetical protein